MMNKNDIWNALVDLSGSQGCYGRLIEEIENSGNKDKILEELENQNFNDIVDLVLYIEG